MADDLKTKAPIYWAYRDLFGRDPNEGELAHWRDVYGQLGQDPDKLRDTISYVADQHRREQLGSLDIPDNEVLKNNDYAAYLRKMKFDEAEIRSTTLAQKEAIQRQIQARAGQFDFQRYQAANNIERDFASRGLRRAGGRIKRTNEATAAINQQQGQYELGQREQMAANERLAASRIADMERERAERERQAREQMTQDSVTR